MPKLLASDFSAVGAFVVGFPITLAFTLAILFASSRFIRRRTWPSLVFALALLLVQAAFTLPAVIRYGPGMRGHYTESQYRLSFTGWMPYFLPPLVVSSLPLLGFVASRGYLRLVARGDDTEVSSDHESTSHDENPYSPPGGS